MYVLRPVVELTIKLSVDARLSCNLHAAKRILPSALRFNLVFLLIISCAPLNALTKARTLNQFTYQTWQTGSGLPQNTVHSVLQGRNGYLWLATEGGLVRFDGFHFEVFDTRNTPELKSNNIQSLLEDRAGALWVATASGLYKFAGNRFEIIAEDGNLLALGMDRDGVIWALTPTELLGVSSAKRAAQVRKYTPEDTAAKFTGALAMAGDGTLWLGTQNGLRKFHNGRFSDVADGLPSTNVNALLLDRSSRLWIGSDAGLFLAGSRNSLPLSSRHVLALFEDWEGAIWVGDDLGLARLEGTPPGMRFSRALPGSTVIALAEDAERDLWVGTESNGLTVLRNPKFVTYTSRDGLAGDVIRSVFESSNRTLAVGTSQGLSQLKEGRFESLNSTNGLSSDVVLSLNEDRDRNLLAGTPDGLNRITPRGISIITSADGLADDFIRSVYRDIDGSLWIGTRRGLSHEISGNRFTTYTHLDGLGSDLAGAVLRDHTQSLWVGTLGGLTRYDRGKFVNYTIRDGLSSNIVTALYEDAAGNLWIGTQDGGLNVRHGNRFFALPKQLGLPDAIYGIAEDANGELWISSNRGIVRVNRQALERVAQATSDTATVVWYGTSDGLNVNECSAGGHPEVWKAHDGTIWFATVKGLAALYPDAARLNHVLPPVVLESIAVDNRNFVPSQVQTIHPGHSRIAFTYAGLSFAAPEKVIYRYKLEGFDKEWVDAGSERTAVYTNIPPGTYSFRVLARNNDGFWSASGAALSFRLEPHFYQTIWFYLLAALALVLCGYLIYRARVAGVQARFDAVLGERSRIAREIHDTLAQGFVGVSVQLEIVSRLLASSTEGAREHLDQARIQVRDSISEARRSIWQLRSQGPENADLASRISKAAAQAIGSHPVKFELDVRGANRPLSAPVEDELLRIGQEAITNAVRHADSKHIHVELAFGARKLRLVVADDGCGFTASPDSGSSNGHFGLEGMRERAEQIKATIQVDSVKGKGTKVIVEAPLT